MRRRLHFPAPIAPLRRLALLAATLVPLAGCGGQFWSFPEQVRGNRVDDEQIAQLVIGTSTRQDATALIGSPTVKAAFDDNTWIYASEVTRPVIAGTNAVQDQRVYVLSFDSKGVLTGIEKRTQDDSLPVNVVERTTPSPGTEASIMQQLLGNIGRYNPGALASPATTGQQGSATNPGNF